MTAGAQRRFHAASVVVSGNAGRVLEVGTIVYGSARPRVRMWIKQQFTHKRRGRSATIPVAIANADPALWAN